MSSYARAGAIIEKNNAYLFMKRIKKGHAYYSVLGGHPEEGETPEETAVREIYEETHLKITVGPLICVLEEYGKEKPGFYFWALSVEGQEKLGGPEAEKTHHENHFELQWIPKEDIKNIILFPTELHRYLMNRHLKDQ